MIRLESENYTVYTAENGEEALEVMDKEHIDLVVLDVMMPKMDGYELTEILREANNTLTRLPLSQCFLILSVYIQNVP